jgi:hypothetical protein
MAYGGPADHHHQQCPADATTVLYNDGGNNTGRGRQCQRGLWQCGGSGQSGGNNASTEPAKRFYKYARPYRWSSSVQVLPALVPAKSSTPTTDGGFTSGHSAEAVRDAVAMAYACPSAIRKWSAAGWNSANRVFLPACTRRWT